MIVERNRNRCYHCDAEVHPGDCVEIGNTRMWLCGKPLCERALRIELQVSKEDDYEFYAGQIGDNDGL